MDTTEAPREAQIKTVRELTFLDLGAHISVVGRLNDADADVKIEGVLYAFAFVPRDRSADRHGRELRLNVNNLQVAVWAHHIVTLWSHHPEDLWSYEHAHEARFWEEVP